MTGTYSRPAPKMRTSADSSQPERASLQSGCSASSAHGTARTEAQRLGLLACLATSNFRIYLRWSMSVYSGSPPLKMRTSAQNSQPERASLESCCSVSSAHGTARTEAQRLGLLAGFATSILQHIFVGPCRALPSALLLKCECLQIVLSQKELAWKAVAQPHLPMALLA